MKGIIAIMHTSKNIITQFNQVIWIVLNQGLHQSLYVWLPLGNFQNPIYTGFGNTVLMGTLLSRLFGEHVNTCNTVVGHASSIDV